MPPKVKLSAQQFLAITTTERTMSVLSIVGSFFIVATFMKWHYFRKPINRLVFFASFGNLMANIATLISTSAIPRNPGEAPSALCQFQGILIQWFMMADSLWVFCMALNVMLVFFRQYNSTKLRKLEKWYLLFAYGVPFVTAFIYIVVEKTTRQRIYGPATIWCWVDARVEWMRIAFFYAPVWVVVSLTLIIYIYTGYTIFNRRRTLKQYSAKVRSSNPEPGPVPVIANPFTAASMGIARTTDISVTYTSNTMDTASTIVETRCTNDSRSSFSSTRGLSDSVPAPAAAAVLAPAKELPANRGSLARGETGIASQAGHERNVIHTADIVAEKRDPYGGRGDTRTESVSYNPNAHRNHTIEGNTAAWSYFKVAFLMFAALFIVWVPSTVNRLQSFISADSPIFGLNLASALVLPLQGFWNMMVYISTTWPECKRATREILDSIAAAKHPDKHRITTHSRKDSDHTLTARENQEFDSLQVPLTAIVKQGPEEQNQYSPA